MFCVKYKKLLMVRAYMIENQMIKRNKIKN